MAAPSAADPDRPEPIRFFLPGPVYVREAIREAMTRPIVGHRSPPFRALYARLAAGLPQVARTSGAVYVATGSATLLMESALVSTVRREVLHLLNGAFSERWAEIGRLLGKSSEVLAVPWGQAIDPDLVRQALRRKRPEAVTLVHNETSTGVVNPVAEIARVVREESDALLLVDAVSSLGGAPFETEAWDVDLVLAGSQKALALPPGLVLFTLSARAAERAAAIPHRGFYTDLLRYRDQHEKGGTITTPAVPLFYALDAQLGRILAEGIEERWRRHADLAATTAAWAAARGLAFASAAGARSPTVSCFEAPAGLAPAQLVQALAGRGFTIGGGYGRFKETTFRIGHMGEVQPADLSDLLAAIDAELATLAQPSGR